MDKLDIEFFNTINKSCEKNSVDFFSLEFTISNLTNWIVSVYPIKTHKTAVQIAIRLSDLGYLDKCNRGFKFSKKLKDVID